MLRRTRVQDARCDPERARRDNDEHACRADWGTGECDHYTSTTTRGRRGASARVSRVAPDVAPAVFTNLRRGVEVLALAKRGDAAATRASLQPTLTQCYPKCYPQSHVSPMLPQMLPQSPVNPMLPCYPQSPPLNVTPEPRYTKCYPPAEPQRRRHDDGGKTTAALKMHLRCTWSPTPTLDAP